MRYSGHGFRFIVARAARAGGLMILVATAVTAAAPAPRASGPEVAAPAPEVTGLRLGRHAGFLRLVFDLTAKPVYDAHATGVRAFEVTLPGAGLPPEGHAALAGDPLAPDLIVRPQGTSGALGFRITSRHDAFIRRAFVIGPPAGGVKPGRAPWRLILDIVPRPGGKGAAPATATGTGGVVARLPGLHGIETPDTAGPPGDGGQADAGTAAAAQAPERATHVEVSWARASRILRELQARQAPVAAAPPPQLVLPEKYHRPPVPLR